MAGQPVPLTIRLNDHAQALVVEPGDTILETLESHGYRMPRSCRNGVCEICEFTLLKGSVQQRYPEKRLHQDNEMQDHQQPVVMGLACTSTPLSDLWVHIKGLKRPGEQIVKRLTCDIVQVEGLNYDVYKVTLRMPPTASQAVEYFAGQYLEIVMPDERKAAFSIGSAPEAGRLLELHIRDASEFSKAIVTTLQTEKTIDVEIPKGDCFVNAATMDGETPIILAAASTGFSQMKSIIEHLLTQGVQNPIHFYWGARIAADLYMPELPLEWVVTHSNVVYHPVVSEPGDQCGWTGRTDLLPDAISQDFDTLKNAIVYTSGSPAMVYALLDACELKGLDEKNMHSDVFAYAPRPKK
ncbi:MAG: 2Fe-2S iron-sulfur cluster binding domain-containing protein [Neptunomonas phycophila]|uniref:2Fe-2S iron-sulfur cluster-binding protein n=1 Tax=Neptunomonas phycophila TaxID=1572645 RepID=UPI003B8EAE65